MKKLVLSLAVLFSVAMISCSSSEKKDADTVDTTATEAVIEETTVEESITEAPAADSNVEAPATDSTK